MSEEAEKEPLELERLLELLPWAGETCATEGFDAERNACYQAASLIRSQAERIRVLEADAARWRDLEEGREVYVRGIRVHLPMASETGAPF